MAAGVESGIINVGKSSVVKNTVIKCSATVENGFLESSGRNVKAKIVGNCFFKNLNETALKGAIAIPAEFVRRHKLYNHADSNNSTKFMLKCFDPPFEKEMVLRKYIDRKRIKKFDDHVVMKGEWKEMMMKYGFKKNKKLKFTLDTNLLKSSNMVFIIME
ncbi:hypothetical protein Tco_0809634 [Tanacetum coccineum]